MSLTMANYPLACKGDIYEQLGENKAALSFAGTKRDERKLADFILSSPEQLGKLSSQELANTLGISQSSVVKFAKNWVSAVFPR